MGNALGVADLGVEFNVEEGRAPPAVALGKFDALHLGHQALVQKAAELGSPYIISFGGMAEVFGLPVTKPITAPLDRARVLSEWNAQRDEGQHIAERVFPFSLVRPLSPEDFVLLLADLGVKGIVAGSNYRFGYKASGDAELLKALGQKYQVNVAIMDMVNKGTERVSSTRIRECLSKGSVDSVAVLLGRRHRCIAHIPTADAVCLTSQGGLSIPLECFTNRLPADGTYTVRVKLERDNGSETAKFVEREVHVTDSMVELSDCAKLFDGGPCHLQMVF